ncbi:MAG: Pyridoxal phosphate-dependent aminotransferase [Parachlamydiales bacterium]|nr:Pyridoxal phosphate-dependent aminotransferase [Parachlamydiales bacterium]
MINWWYTELGEPEKNKLLEAFSEKRMTLSRSVREVEELFAALLHVPYTVMVNSGSSALLMALLALDIQPGDEVIVPSLTWIATAQAPGILHAKVKLCDCTSTAPIIDLGQLEKIVSAKTKVIIPVHLNGRECDMEAIQKIASRFGTRIIEDACKAMFSKGKNGFLGTIGDLGCYSLGMISLVSVGYGGLVVTRSKEIYEKLKKIRDHGVQRTPESYPYLGFNFKISDLLASLAIPQLQNLEKRAQSSVALHDYYSQSLKHPDISILPIDKKSGKVPVYAEAYSERREDVIFYLQEKGIQTSRYHLPIHHAHYLRADGFFPNADRFARNSFILPSGPSQKIEDISFVVETLNQFACSCGANA